MNRSQKFHLTYFDLTTRFKVEAHLLPQVVTEEQVGLVLVDRLELPVLAVRADEEIRTNQSVRSVVT